MLTTRFFHWRTTTSVAKLHNTVRSLFLTSIIHHNLFDHILRLAFVFQTWMKTIAKSVLVSGMSPTLPPRNEYGKAVTLVMRYMYAEVCDGAYK